MQMLAAARNGTPEKEGAKELKLLKDRNVSTSAVWGRRHAVWSRGRASWRRAFAGFVSVRGPWIPMGHPLVPTRDLESAPVMRSRACVTDAVNAAHFRKRRVRIRLPTGGAGADVSGARLSRHPAGDTHFLYPFSLLTPHSAS